MIRERIPVALGARAYDVLIGDDLIAQAGALITEAVGSRRRALVITDRTVARLHLGRLVASLETAGLRVETEEVVPGEAAKSWGVLGGLLEATLARAPDRRLLVIALGGGVVGDLAGFLAAILLRGVDFVQIPTTLLAQVDSSVGGKTGINMQAGKNLVGSFHQPSLVLADLSVLETLPARELRAGYAEIVKHALIRDADFFEWLERHGPALIAGDREARAIAVKHSVETKAAIVARDEKEAGERALLNLGHTFGHALEAATGFGERLLHGEAVSIGLVLAARFSARLGRAAPDVAARVEAHLAGCGMPTGLGQLPIEARDPQRLLALMQHDKKTRDGDLTFVLLRRIGDAEVVSPVAAHDVMQELVAAQQ